MKKKKQKTKIDLDMGFMESIIVYNALMDDTYLASIIDTVKPDFFKNTDIKLVFKVVCDFYLTRQTIPNASEIKARLVNDEQKESFKRVLVSFKRLDKNYNKDELLANTEQFLRERALYIAIEKTVDDYSKEDNETSPSETLSLFNEACNISLVDNLGHDYFNDIDNHIISLERIYNYIPTGYSWLDKMLGGGLLADGRALYVFSGVTNSGKSIILGNLAANMCFQNKTVIVISLEMSEDVYSKRLSSQMSKIPMRLLKTETDQLKEFVNTHRKSKPNGRIFIKEYPPKSITVSHIRSYIEKLIRKKGIKPDAIVIDYVNLLLPSTVTGQSYTDVKQTTEQLRALSYIFECPVITATQLNRDAFKNNKADPGLEATSESMGLAMTADAQFSIWSDESDRELGIIHMGCQKNRFGQNFGKNTFRLDYDTLSISELKEDYTSSDNIGEAENSLDSLLKGIE